MQTKSARVQERDQGTTSATNEPFSAPVRGQTHAAQEKNVPWMPQKALVTPTCSHPVVTSAQNRGQLGL